MSSPPPLQEILYPRLRSTYPSSDPPPPDGWLRAWVRCYLVFKPVSTIAIWETYGYKHAFYIYTHRRMRRGGQGGCSPPPQLLGNSVFWAAAVLFWGQQQWWEGGVFQFSRGRMTSRGQCPRGVLVNVQEWGCFSIFRRANDVTQTMSKGGGGACEIPPSGNPVSAPVICVKFRAINPSAPP